MLSDLEKVELKLRLFDLEGELEAIMDNPNVDDYEYQRMLLAWKYKEKISLAIHIATNRRAHPEYLVLAVQTLICDDFEGGDEEARKARIEWYDYIEETSKQTDEFESVERLVDVALEYIQGYESATGVNHKELSYKLSDLKDEMLKAKEEFDNQYQTCNERVKGLEKKISFLKEILGETSKENKNEDNTTDK